MASGTGSWCFTTAACPAASVLSGERQHLLSAGVNLWLFVWCWRWERQRGLDRGRSQHLLMVLLEQLPVLEQLLRKECDFKAVAYVYHLSEEECGQGQFLNLAAGSF